MDTTKKTTSIYPWIEGNIEPGSSIVFHLGRDINIKAHIYSDGTFVMIDSHPHTYDAVNKIFKAFNTPISGEDRLEIWPISMDNLFMLKRWKKCHNTPRTTSEETTQSLTNNTKQNVTFELQDQRADFRREEIPRGSILRGRITEAAISIQPLSHTTMVFLKIRRVLKRLKQNILLIFRK